MSGTIVVSPRPSEEIEQLNDIIPARRSDASAELGASGSFQGAGKLSRVPPPRIQSSDLEIPAVATMPESGSLPTMLSASSSLGGQSFGAQSLASSGSNQRSPRGSMNGDLVSSTSSNSVSDHSRSSFMPPVAGLYNASASSSSAHLALRYRKPFAQRVLQDGEKVDKPWLDDKKRKSSDRKAYWIFNISLSLGLIGAAVLMYFAYAAVPKDKYCLVLDEQFEGNTINKDIWFHELETGGFGNGQFDWTTDSANNSFVEDGKLYIVPTLTSDALGEAAIMDGYALNLTLSGTCTASNKTDPSCAVASNITKGVILPPVQSARLMTNFSRTIKYGRVEVKARMPTGDWIWPAVWMMPKDSVYGQWPRSGEIDIFESRGNLPTKRDSRGTNQMQSSLHFGPNFLFDGYGFATKARNLWRDWFNQGSHTFGLEWTEKQIYTWEHSPMFKNLEVNYDDGFWKRGKFPSQMANGTLLSNPWAAVQGKDASIAPFDQEFYLILNVAVGGTNGYFEDGLGDDKPWSNDAENARAQFWESRDRWLPTWPKDPKQRGMEIEYVKMWQKC